MATNVVWFYRLLSTESGSRHIRQMAGGVREEVQLMCWTHQATSFDGVFLLVALHYTALVCNYCFLLWLIEYLSIYDTLKESCLALGCCRSMAAPCAASNRRSRSPTASSTELVSVDGDIACTPAHPLSADFHYADRTRPDCW